MSDPLYHRHQLQAIALPVATNAHLNEPALHATMQGVMAKYSTLFFIGVAEPIGLTWQASVCKIENGCATPLTSVAPRELRDMRECARQLFDAKTGEPVGQGEFHETLTTVSLMLLRRCTAEEIARLDDFWMERPVRGGSARAGA